VNADVNAENSGYLDRLYQDWLRDPASVDKPWREYFSGIDSRQGDIPPGDIPPGGDFAYKQSRVNALLWAYRDVGAIYADINPLGGYETPKMRYMRITVEGAFETLTLAAFGLSDDDLETEFDTGGYFEPPRAPLRQIIEFARRTYLSTLGVEFLHIRNRVMRRWLLTHIESPSARPKWCVNWRPVTKNSASTENAISSSLRPFSLPSFCPHRGANCSWPARPTPT